jgi:hypothetical protein
MVARLSLQLVPSIKSRPLAALIQHSQSARELSSLSLAVHSTAR